MTPGTKMKLRQMKIDQMMTTEKHLMTTQERDDNVTMTKMMKKLRNDEADDTESTGMTSADDIDDNGDDRRNNKETRNISNQTLSPSYDRSPVTRHNTLSHQHVITASDEIIPEDEVMKTAMTSTVVISKEERNISNQTTHIRKRR